MKSIMKLALIIASLGLALTIAAPVREAGAETSNNTTLYRVKQGDTLQLIAAEFYGDRTRAIFIMVENKIAHTKPLKPGERLRIPKDREITTSPEDTWASLANTHLGDARRAPFLAEFNKKSPDEAVPAGTPLHIPVTVTHTAEGPETLANISLSYFGEAKHAEMLRRYNFREKASIEKGESIVVPAFHVHLTEAKVPPTDAEAKARQNARRAAGDEALKALPKAWQAWRAGEHGDIEALLSKINIDYLETELAVEVTVLRGLAHIAEDKENLAIEDFKKVQERKKGHVLRKFDYSPKVLEIWEKADGKVE